MIRKSKLPIGIAFAGMLITFLMNIGNNVLTTSFIRSLYSFVSLFVLFVIVQLLLRAVAGMQPVHTQDSEVRGQHIDIVTPADDQNMVNPEGGSEALEEQFAPLKPPKIASDQIDSDLVVNAVRQLTQE